MLRAKKVIKIWCRFIFLVLCGYPFFIGSKEPLYAKKHWEKTLLIINYNHPFYDSIPFLKKLYGKEFPHIVFYGERQCEGVEKIDHNFGWFGQRVLEDAMRKWPKFEGYLMINDDCLVNYWNLRRLDRKEIWHCPYEKISLQEREINWNWWKMTCGLQSLQPALQHMPNRFHKTLQRNLGRGFVQKGMCDVIYFPQRFRKKFLRLCPLFTDVFLELGIPVMCGSLSTLETVQKLQAVFLWGEEREKYSEAYSWDIDFLHPVKFSSEECRRFAVEQIKKHQRVWHASSNSQTSGKIDWKVERDGCAPSSNATNNKKTAFCGR